MNSKTIYEKYELMVKLGIVDSQLMQYDLPEIEALSLKTLAAVLERACREWLEKEGVYIEAAWEGKTITEYEVSIRTPELENVCCGGHCDSNQSSVLVICCNTFDGAQIEALKYCLKNRDTLCTTH